MESPTTADIKQLANSVKIDIQSGSEQDNIDNFIEKSSSDQDDQPDVQSKQSDDQNSNKSVDVSNIISEREKEIKKEIKRPSPTQINKDHNELKEAEELDPYEIATPKEKKQMKYRLLRKLAQLIEENKLIPSEDFSMNHDYYDIKREYDYHTGEKDKKFFVRKATTWTIHGIGILELISKYYNFLNLDGWKDTMELNKEELISILGEIYEKYKIMGHDQPPEVRLIILLGTTLLTTVLSNYGSKLLGSIFGNGRNTTLQNIEIDATKQAMTNSNLVNYVNKDKQMFDNINQQVELEKIRQNEFLNRQQQQNEYEQRQREQIEQRESELLKNSQATQNTKLWGESTRIKKLEDDKSILSQKELTLPKIPEVLTINTKHNKDQISIKPNFQHSNRKK